MILCDGTRLSVIHAILPLTVTFCCRSYFFGSMAVAIVLSIPSVYEQRECVKRQKSEQSLDHASHVRYLCAFFRPFTVYTFFMRVQRYHCVHCPVYLFDWRVNGDWFHFSFISTQYLWTFQDHCVNLITITDAIHTKNFPTDMRQHEWNMICLWNCGIDGLVFIPNNAIKLIQEFCANIFDRWFPFFSWNPPTCRQLISAGHVCQLCA